MARRHQQTLKSFEDLPVKNLAIAEQPRGLPVRTPHIEHEPQAAPIRLAQVAGADEARHWFSNNVKLGYDQIFMTRRVLTVALARLLLDVNPVNRRVIRSAVDEFVQALGSGMFNSLNGEALIVSRDGMLNNGQNRATAVLESGVEQEFLFVFGVTRESRKTLDQARRRNAHDYLSMEGIDVARYISSVAMLHWQWMNGRNLHQGNHSSKKPGASQLAEHAIIHIDVLSTSVHFIPRRGVNMVGGVPVLAFAHWLFTQNDTVAGNNFISQLIDGVGLTQGSPILTVRERLMTDRSLNRADKIELIIRAWNAHREGREPTVLPVKKRIPEIV